MHTRIEPDAVKTKEYLRYIIREVLRRSPLRVGKVVNIKFVEDQAPLPEITEVPEKGVTANDIVRQIDNEEARREQQCSEIAGFTQNELWDFCDLWSADGNGKYPMAIIFRFILKDVDRFYKKAQESGISANEIRKLTGKALPSASGFNVDTSQLSWRGETIPIPPGTVQYSFCKIAFMKKPMENLSWDEVAAEKEGVDKTEVNQNSRRIYDAMQKVNDRIRAQAGNELFEWTHKAFRRKE